MSDASTTSDVSKKSRAAALLWSLAALGRFYLGKIGTGILFLVTLGGFGIWYLIDVIMLIAGKTKDKAGKPVMNWGGKPVEIIIPAVILGLVIIGGASSGGMNSSSSGSTSSSVAVSDEKPADPLKIGKAFTSNGYEILVTQVEKRDSLDGGFEAKLPSDGAVFVCVQYTFKNITDKPKSGTVGLGAPSVKIEDPAGTTYDNDVEATMYYQIDVGDDSKVLSDLNPGLKSKSAYVFEVAKDNLKKPGWKLAVKAGDTFYIPFSL